MNVTVSVAGEDDVEERYQEILVGCLLAIAGNLLISISLNIQKHTHNTESTIHSDNAVHYLRRPLWWLGVSLMVFGEIGNFTAYGFAPASVVAPLGTTTVIANMFIAVIFLREQLRPEDLFGSALSVVGAFLIVSFSKRREMIFTSAQIVQALKSTRFIVYITIELAALTILFFMLYVMKKDNVLVLLLITSIIASFTVISAKGVSGLLNLTFSGLNQFQYPIVYILAVVLFSTAIIQVYYLNQAMKGSDSTVVVPTNFVFFTISVITSGIVFFNEFFGLYSLSIFMFILGCFLSFVGVYFITFNRVSTDQSADSDLLDDRTPIKPIEAEISGGRDSGGGRKIMQDIFPTWLLASVNRSEVQPRQSHPQWRGPEEEDEEEKEKEKEEQSEDGRIVGDQDELVCH